MFPLSYLAVDLFLSKLFYVFSCNCSILFCFRINSPGKRCSTSRLFICSVAMDVPIRSVFITVRRLHYFIETVHMTAMFILQFTILYMSRDSLNLWSLALVYLFMFYLVFLFLCLFYLILFHDQLIWAKGADRSVSC